MMERNYPTPSFADPLAAPAQTAAWAYDRSTPSIKPSLSYGTSHPSHPDSELLHRQTYTASHQLPGYATAHHPTGLSGIFDTGLHTTGSNTTETSVMNFLSAIESRNPPAGPTTASILPQFRTTSWQTGMHSSTATELFVTGALPVSGTFAPTSALSAYQHPNTFSTRNFATTPSLTLQDAAFSPTSNGLLSTHDPLLQIKPPQNSVPTALAFDRIGSTVLSTSIPPQSSTYRSAQESAPHLLQPQFSLLPSALSCTQQATQPYSTPVFTGSAASIERALQRECSVIKHHQRPSSTHSIPTQLSGAQHSLQGYLTSGSGSGVNFQDTSRQSTMSCSPVEDTTQVSNGGPQQKTPQATLEQTQAYPSTIPSPSYSSATTTKTKDCSGKRTPRSSKATKSQSVSPDVQPQTYTSSTQKPSTVIASQPEVYSSAQLTNLMSESQSQSYASSQNIATSVSHSQVYSSTQSEKLPSLYKTLTSFSGQSDNLTSVSQSLSYSSSQQQVLRSVGHNENYTGQTQNICSVNDSQSYTSNHTQGLPTVSYTAQSQGLSSVSPSQSYASGQSLTLTSQSMSFSLSRAQNLPVSSPTQNYILMHSSPTAQNKSGSSPQKYMPSVQSPTFSSTCHSQALQNNRSPDTKPSYSKRKSDSNLFVTSKQEDEEFAIQDLQELQQASLEATAQSLSGNEISEQNPIYVVSKADDRYNSQSVIRTSSRPEDQIIGLSLSQGSKKDEEMSTVTHHGQNVSTANGRVASDSKKVSNLVQPPHANISAEDLKQQTLLHKVQDTRSQDNQDQVINIQQGQTPSLRNTQQICLPSAQVLLEPTRDLQMVLLQPSLLHSGLDQAKISPQMQQMQAQFLQMEDHIIQTSGGQNQQQLLPQNSEALKMDATEASKALQQHLMVKDNFSQASQQESKLHFALSSICFPDSVLLGDERSILSNVDDILAATAAACGVTPQDFAKPNSADGELQSLDTPSESKSHFQSVDVRHVPPNFSSSHSLVHAQNMNMTLNGGQLNIGLHLVSSVQSKNSELEHQGLDSSEPGLQSGLTSPALNSRNEMGDKSMGSFQKQRSISQDSEEETEEATNGRTVNRANDTDFITSRRSLSDESAASESEYTLPSDDYDPTGLLSKARLPVKPKSKTTALPCIQVNIKDKEIAPDFSPDSFLKKKSKPKGSIKLFLEDENGNQKPAKRTGQSKRQNSRGSDGSQSASDSCYDSYQHQERIRQKIREVEEKQPEVKTGFIGSFLDFLKSGPKQQFSSPPIRMPNRSRKPPITSVRPLQPPPTPPVKAQHVSLPLVSSESMCGNANHSRRLEDDLKKNLETLPSFSSDEDESVGKNQDLQKSISSALSVLDEPADKKNKTEPEANPAGSIVKQEQGPSTPLSVLKQDPLSAPPQPSYSAVADDSSIQENREEIPADQLALKQLSVAIEGSTDEDQSDSGGEGMYRERDEFVVKIEDIDSLKTTLKEGKEPPAIWKVQKALLQKFVPELRNGNRVFSGTNSYLGYFGDAKTKYKRVYVKFIDTVNKKEYVRVCNRKPRCKPLHSMRSSQSRSSSTKPATAPLPSPAPNNLTQKVPSNKTSASKPKAKQQKVKAEPPPKKRKKWKEVFSPSPSESSQEAQSEDDEFTPPVPFATRFLNTRTMKETFKSYVELLISVALDADMMGALEKENDELLLPHMKKVDGMITDNRRRLLPKLRVGQSFKSALDSFPELVVLDLKKSSDAGSSCKIKLSGKVYNKRTLRATKTSSKLPLEYNVDKDKTQWFSLYHSLQHYKYHTYLLCKDEIAAIQKDNEDLGQEETVQLCMKNAKWVESLFDKFGELLTQVQQTCL